MTDFPFSHSWSLGGFPRDSAKQGIILLWGEAVRGLGIRMPVWCAPPGYFRHVLK